MGTRNDITLINNFGEQTQNEVIGGNGCLQLQRSKVTFAELNAAGTGVALVLPLSKAIPDNAIIKQVWYNVLTTFADNGTAGDADTSTLSLGLNTNVDLKAAVAISNGANPWDAGIGAGIPVGTAATMVKATAERTLKCVWTAGTGNATALTAGEMDVFVEYVQGT